MYIVFLGSIDVPLEHLLADSVVALRPLWVWDCLAVSYCVVTKTWLEAAIVGSVQVHRAVEAAPCIVDKCTNPAWLSLVSRSVKSG